MKLIDCNQKELYKPRKFHVNESLFSITTPALQQIFPIKTIKHKLKLELFSGFESLLPIL